jgi:hypothetical protein
MEESAYWRLVQDAWHEVDGGALVAALGRGEGPEAAALEAGFDRLVPALAARLEGLALDDAWAAIERHRRCARALDDSAIAAAAGVWMYDAPDRHGEALSVLDLLGEAFYRRVSADPAAASALAGAAGLGATGGWRRLAGPVRERWRAALLAEIPAAFAEVPYPGDEAVSSGDWPTTEECRYFCGQDWRTVDRRTLHRRYADLGFFTAPGVHYLLPAFLMAPLEDPDGDLVAGLAIAEQLVFAISSGYLRRVMALLSARQRDVLADVLRFELDGGRDGPLAEPDDDLALALDVLDLDTPTPRRPRRR